MVVLYSIIRLYISFTRTASIARSVAVGNSSFSDRVPRGSRGAALASSARICRCDLWRLQNKRLTQQAENNDIGVAFDSTSFIYSMYMYVYDM